MLRAAGKAEDTGPVLSIYYAQKWRDVNVQPDNTLKPPELAARVEQQAYDAWLALQPSDKNDNNTN